MVLFVLAEATPLITLSLLECQSSSSLVWWKILAQAISLESNLAMVRPSLERLHPFFPGHISGFSDTPFRSSQLAMWNYSNMLARKFVQVNRLWRGIAERFLYSAFYVEEEWRMQRFIDTVKLNPRLAEQVRTLVILPHFCTRKEAGFDPLVLQVLGLCHGIDALVIQSGAFSSPLPLFESLDTSRRLMLLSALSLRNEEFPIFMINSGNYASLQTLELSVDSFNSDMLPSLPEHITFPSLQALILGNLDPLVLNVVGKWELPSLKELSVSRWNPLINSVALPLIQRSYDRLELFNTCIDLLHDRTFHDIIRAPPLHLRNLTLNFQTTVCT